MHKITLSTIAVLISLIGFAQKGIVLENEVLQSTSLKRPVNYAVYLPPDYTTSQRNYPVVYLLHGYTDDHTGWLQFGEVNRLADVAIADGTIPPMIVIMPDADSSWYINAYNGNENFEDFFIKEFIPGIEKKFRIKSEKSFRGIAGLSMGGYGSLIYALKYPDMFAATAPLSAGVINDDDIVAMPDAQWDRMFEPLFGKAKGKDRLNKAWKANSVLELVQQKSTAELSKVRYWIDCGDDDFLAKGNALLHIALLSKKVPHEYRVRDGAHTWTYWRTGITDALAFIGTSFRR